MKNAPTPRRGSRVFYFTLHPSYFVLIFVLCGVVAIGPTARADEFSRVSRHSVRLFSFGTLRIDTRVGDIRIEGWDEPRVDIEAEKVVRAGSEANAQSLFDRVGVQVVGGDKEVRLRTLYPARRLWRPFRGQSRLSVNLRVKMPYDANLVLKCVNGDVRVFGIIGHERLNVSYGDVEINLPDVYRLRSLNAHAWLGYVQSDLRFLDEDSAGLHQKLSYWNSGGSQEIVVRVRLGGVYVYGYGN